MLQQVFLASLKDSAAEVRRTALQAVASMVPWLDEEPHVALFKDLVPLTIQVSSPHSALHSLANPRLPLTIQFSGLVPLTIQVGSPRSALHRSAR